MPSAAAIEQSSPAASIPAEPMGLLAVRLLALAQEAGPRGLIHITSSDRRAEGLGRLLADLAPSLEVIVVPPWDCLPYDRAAPSREVMGRRAAALRRSVEAGREPRILIATPDALLQRVPPKETWAQAGFVLQAGEPFDLPALEAYLDRAGYVLDERVDEPGEAAIRGGVIDVFPAGAAAPFRLEHADGRIAAIRCYDPISQRTENEVGVLRLDPASEIVPPQAGGEAIERFPGAEHWLPEFYPRLDTLFDYAPDAAVVLEAKAEERCQAVLEQVAEAYESRTTLRPERAKTQPGRRPLPPERLYLGVDEWSACVGRRAVTRASADDSNPAHATPRFATSANPRRAFADYIRDAAAAGRRIVLTGAADDDRRTLTRQAEKAAGRPAEPASDWDAVRHAAPGSLLVLNADLDPGFADADENVAVIAAADMLGSRAKKADQAPAPALLPTGDTEFRLGDAVIHLDHGMGVLQGLDAVTAGGSTQDTLRLDYAGNAKLLAPVDEIERVWRYASEAETVSLDRLDGESWPKRRAQVESAVAESARQLVELAQVRAATAAPKLTPPRQAFERFAARFPFSETPDQARAIADTLADLASGRARVRRCRLRQNRSRAAGRRGRGARRQAGGGGRADHRAGAPAPPHRPPPLRRPRNRSRRALASGKTR
jgi:transcription-repair coupling factor (superfamily II helicase)